MTNSKSEKKLEALLDFIKSYTLEHKYPPSVREIGKSLEMKSTATVYYYLQKLEERGLIKKSPSKNRAIELTDNIFDAKVNKIPLIGVIPAGKPILATESIDDYVTIPTELFSDKDGLFLLKVKGESMIEAGIYDGDLIIVRQQNYADNGDIIAALIDNEATVKRFFKESNYIRLKPENSTMSDIIVDDVSILGLVVGLIRKIN